MGEGVCEGFQAVQSADLERAAVLEAGCDGPLWLAKEWLNSSVTVQGHGIGTVQISY